MSFVQIGGRVGVTTCMSMSEQRYKRGVRGYILVHENQGSKEVMDGIKLEMSEADIGHAKLAGMLNTG